MKTKADTRCIAAVVAMFFAAGPAWALDLPELMGLLAQKRNGEASFVELRHVNGLDQTLRASGTLSFVAPDRFARHTLEPRAESLVVDGNNVTLKRGGRSRTLALDAEPEASAIVEAMRGTLTGNAAALQRYFRPSLSGDAEQWLLDLWPLEVRLSNQVRIVRIGGRRGEVLSVEMQLADGDRSIMTIKPLIKPTIKP